MSTILKALEKLEREKEAVRTNGPLPVVSASGHGGRPAGWYVKPWFWLGLVSVIIVILGGTAWHFYRQSRENTLQLAERGSFAATPPIQHPPDAHDKAARARTPGEANPEPRQPVQSSHSNRISQPKPVQEKSVSQKRTPPGGPAEPSGSAAQHPAPETAPALETAPTTEVPAFTDDSEKVAAPPSEPPLRQDTASKRSAPDDPYKNTPLLSDGRLRIHAIAWSPQPAERMAVINSRIIHEGDSVQDFAVVAIRPDDVVVREPGKGVWRVEFGRP